MQRNQYVQVQYADYQLENLAALKRLKPGNYGVEAYWLEDESGCIGEVYLYQNGQYVGRAAQIATFTTAKAEWTEADTAAMTEQSKYISQFDSFVKKGKSNISAINILPADLPEMPNTGSVGETLQGPADNGEDAHSASPAPAGDDIEALMERYAVADYAEYAIESL